jgi:GntR family transcriptional regulator, transcriptional repressor for pyruvate dehydrogenase complex
MSSPASRFSAHRRGTIEQIAFDIRRYLESSDLQPGDRLGTEPELAQEFGVSRPTLREALRILDGAHLIRSIPGRNGGIFVNSTANDGMSRAVSESVASMLAAESISLAELLDARIYLEVPLAGLAARHASPETIEALSNAIAAAEGHAPGSSEFNAADREFHSVVARAAGNALLVGLTGWILDVLQPSLTELIGPGVDAQDVLRQHQMILRAIRRGQPAAAERAMRAHLEHIRSVVPDRTSS